MSHLLIVAFLFREKRKRNQIRAQLTLPVNLSFRLKIRVEYTLANVIAVFTAC